MPESRDIDQKKIIINRCDATGANPIIINIIFVSPLTLDLRTIQRAI